LASSTIETTPKESAVVYGLSSEGYEIASKLAVKGYEVSIIDEMLGTAMELRPQIAGDYRELRSLLADEVLMKIKPSKESISKAQVVFFAPKLRRKEEDLLSEVKVRLGDVSKNLNSGALFLFCLPLGIAGTKEIIEKIEHFSGLANNKTFFFAYTPLDSDKPSVFGFDSSSIPHLEAVEASGFSMEISSLAKAEIIHAQRVISKHSTMASAYEAARRLTQMGAESPREYKQVYVEDLCNHIFDLDLILDSLETGDPILSIATGSSKSIDGYGRFLVERVRDFVRVKQLKAARLKIILFTDTDPLTMRGDKINTANDLMERLRDYFSDIDCLNIMKEGFTLPMGLDRTNLLVFLSGSAELKLMELYEEQITMTKSHMMRANLPVEFVS
jgi:hypothetical protein